MIGTVACEQHAAQCQGVIVPCTLLGSLRSVRSLASTFKLIARESHAPLLCVAASARDGRSDQKIVNQNFVAPCLKLRRRQSSRRLVLMSKRRTD